MGQRELMEALRKEGKEKCAAIRREAEEEVERVREAAEADIARLREENARRRDVACAAEAAAILSDAEGRGRLILLEAENALAERLGELACRALPILREGDYAETFAALVEELPPCEWETVKVSPADMKLAKRHFPKAEVETDDELVGGVEATGAGGDVRVVNTLEKRLERGWPEMLPGLFGEISKQVENS